MDAPAAATGAAVTAVLVLTCVLAARRLRRGRAVSTATQTMPEIVLADPEDLAELAARSHHPPPRPPTPVPPHHAATAAHTHQLVQQLQQMAVDDLHSMAARADTRHT